MQILPPLNALKAFEVFARHLNYSHAGEELNVTHAAISQQIKLLENYLGIILVVRKGKQFELSEQGKYYAKNLSAAFHIMHEATAKLKELAHPKILTLQLPATLSARWFIPHLHLFQKRYPELELRISTRLTPADFELEKVDAALFYGELKLTSFCSHLLFEDSLVAVCSPKYQEEISADLNNDTLAQHKFIYVQAPLRENDARYWFEAAKLTEPQQKQRLYFQDTLQALNAAEAGLGILITHRPFVEFSLQNDHLTKISTIEVPLNKGYYLIYPEVYQDRDKNKKFRAWLLELCKS